MLDMSAIAQEMQSYVCEVRHELHAHPETRWETTWTRQFIVDQVKKMGFDPKELEGGIVVDIKIPGATETILFRADFDALPVPEETGLPFSSKISGVSHACGHDVNVAMMLGFLRVISEDSVTLTKNLRIIFSDAEEGPGTAPRPESGEEVLIEEDVLNGVSRAYALHIGNFPGWKLGEFRSCPGPMFGNSGRIFFKIKCSGGHVALPHEGVNGLLVMNEIMNRLGGFVSRNFSPFEPVSLQPADATSLRDGGSITESTANVMPSAVPVWYAFRTALPREEHIKMTKLILEEIKAIAESMNATIEDARLIYGHPAMINDPGVYEHVKDLLVNAGESVVKMHPELGGESFAYHAMRVPSVMFVLSGTTPQSGGHHHTPTFNPDESIFWKGVLFWLHIATS